MEESSQKVSFRAGDDCPAVRATRNDYDGIPEDLREELVEAQAEFQKERSNWLKAKVLYTSLQNVLEDARLGFDTALSQPQLNEILEKVTQAEVKYCAQKCRSVSQESKPSCSSETEKILRSLIERDLKASCEQTLAFHDGLSPGTRMSETVVAARAMNLGKIIQEEKKKLEMSYSELSDVQNTEKQLFSSCMEELLQLAEILSEVMTKYRIKLQPKMDEERFSNLVSRCEAVRLKAANMALKLKKEIYTSDSIAALQVIKTELTRCKRSKQQEIVATEKQLDDFKNLGEEFNSIVTEYNQLQIDIDKRDWALKKLHS